MEPIISPWLGHVFQFSPSVLRLGIFYFICVFTYISYCYFWARKRNMARSPFMWLNAFLLALFTVAYAQITSPPTTTSTVSVTQTSTSTKSQFTVPSSVGNGANLIANINDPQAVNAQNVCPGYTATYVKNTTHGLTADLHLAGAACNVYGTDIDSLKLTVEYQAGDRLHIEITPTYTGSANSSWFVLPEALVPKAKVERFSGGRHYDLEFSYSNSPTFSFTVKRLSTGDVLWSSKGSKLVFENQFIEFGSTLPENYNLYGLGEVIHGLRLGNNFTRTLFAADVGDPVDRNLYSDHPFYLDTRYFEINDTSGDITYVANATDATAKYTSYSHGVYLRNAHAQEILLLPTNITWRTLGGNIDLYFYAGPTQKKVTEAYQKSTIGLPAMQQYFSFGYHQCRWGYTGWKELQSVVDNFKKFSIPLDTIWTDIDYMNQYRDFENDQKDFSYFDGANFLSQLHANGQHYVPIIDSAVYVPNPMNASDGYPTFNRGNDTNAFMLNPDGSLYIGDVWPGYTVFPDFIGATLGGGGAFRWWIDEVSRWHQNVSFDGIWIDMSEVSSFCVGSCGTGMVTLNPAHPPFKLPGEPGSIIYDYPEGFAKTNASEAASALAASSSQSALAASSASAAAATMPPATTTPYLRTTPTPGVREINHPPYVINNIQGDLAVHAVSPNATHHGGTVEYDFHNLFGHQILNATYHALLNIAPLKRPFIIGRSTFAGTGVWAGHWGGDNASLFLYMVMSIPQALSFSLFGIPMFGVDTCGFNGNSDEELCNRWMQLSAFFTFYRNHNVKSANSQEPYIWASVTEASKKAMAIRYLLLPYIYTLFYQSHTTGSTTMRALAWEFPNDPSLASADRQFLLGPSLMITPVLNQGYTNVSGVFPGIGDGEVWYDWYNQSAVTARAGENVTIDAPLGHIPVYIRGGSVLPTQEPGLTTAASRKNPWGLIVALDASGDAGGSLYVDDGESLKPNATLHVKFAAHSSTLVASPSGRYMDTNSLANITVLGVASPPSNVKFNSTAVSGWNYNNANQILVVTGLGKVTSNGAWATKWELEWA